ncbi:MAG: 2Fe-2S iron-sulfur cluster-binding protein [Desulfobacterales bacterium]|nr:2Fe-2S iron-sulfur cluster-binding protein [Desulfobacterales bacterium]MDX2510724.1 2Fe-2S iron-sulfur cluster-binding protein [Desulfobacterales bacterium]
MNRLHELPTLRIDTQKTQSLKYRGKSLQGFAGDTVATALYANGTRVFARSLKYHRPRGLYSLDGESSNTCMEVDGVPNVRTENTLLKDGMVVKAQNVKGSADFDLMAFTDKLDWMMPAGFYYKTMHKPAAIWPVAMKAIRKAAGVGTISANYEVKGRYDEIFLTADVCIIGGGAAGMMAALAAAESGVRVVLLESRPYLGGCWDYRVNEYNQNKPLFARSRELAGQVESIPNIRVFKHTSMVGAYNNNLITAFQVGKNDDAFTERYIEIRSKSVVVATGCIERPLIFENNERPGVMQVACAHRLARSYGLLPGKEAVFSVGHDLGLEAALDLFDLGLKIPYVADIREDGHDDSLLEALAQRKVPVLKGWVAAKAHGCNKVTRVTLTTLDGTIRRQIPCDLLVASAGHTPVNGPLILAQAKMAYDNHTGYFLPQDLPENMFSGGRMTGCNHPQSVEASGRLAGIKALAAIDMINDAAVSVAKKAAALLPGADRGCKLVTAPVKGRKSFICFDEDTTIKNIKQAIDMGFDVPELIKRFTSAGTGPGQGGIPGHNLPLYVSKYTASVSKPMPTTVRPPLVPTLLATYAGAHHHMFKRTPLHAFQKREGGIFRNIGVWQRARYFSQDFQCKNEILNVRNNVGMLDSSTLGKFRIFGPDALKALQRLYVSDMSNIKKGRIKYSAMCNDDGCVIDDGIVVKQSDNDYYLTTSSGRAGNTVEWFRFHTRFDGWKYHMVNLTDSMGVINVSGPNARKVLKKIVNADVSNKAFSFAGYREFTIKNTIPVRAMRLGFVGELSFELHVPSSYMQSVWDMLMSAGAEFNIQNFGLEAQNVLRMEKGHIILGQESEQRTNLLDLGLGFLWDRKKAKAKTVGAVALRQAENDPGRFKLVGIRMEDDTRAPRDGALIVDTRVRGYVATARKSFTTGEAVGMALVESQLSKPGSRLDIYEDECNENRLYARVVSMPFYDPEGKRMKM